MITIKVLQKNFERRTPLLLAVSFYALFICWNLACLACFRALFEGRKSSDDCK